LTKTLDEYLQAFSLPHNRSTLTHIGRGVEREALRVMKEGRLADSPHQVELGSALTHPYITTDYSETLLEFITPVSHSAETTISQLKDIQRFTFEHINGELLWPLSMPCFVDDDDKIQLAQYGKSNIGQMKTVYRQGLKNRYGSMMQVIAGIHFNFSFSEDFWKALKDIDGSQMPLDEFISARYFALIRNYKRFCWLIPYLYGSSPVLCGSFLQNRKTNLPFKRSESGYVYLEYATSLRMSDLGYTNSAQSSLHICYNNLESYVSGVKHAIRLSSDEFAKIGVKVDGEYKQLNSNVLQIENELYAPIRPKRVAKSGEKPSEALARGGVEYIEVRALDVNPFVDTGISIEQIHFLDVFLTFCALLPSPELNEELQSHYEANMDNIVLRGRDPELMLIDGEKQRSIKEWGVELFSEFDKVAVLLDQAYQSQYYQQAVKDEYAKVVDSSLTPSAKLLDLVVNQNENLTQMALSWADNYQVEALKRDYQSFDLLSLEQAALESIQKQEIIEQADTLSFDDFLTQYFND
jgi:glutamate--cysteine ligase